MSRERFTLKGFVVLFICVLFFLYEFFLRTVLGTYQSPIMIDLKLTSFQFSLLSTTLFFVTYGAMQIPVGIIVDNIGLKKALIIGASTCTIAAIGFGYCSDFTFAVIYRILMGFGAAFGFICVLIAIYDWMPNRYNALFIGISLFIGTLGPILGAGPLDSLSQSNDINWRFVFLVLGGIGLALVILIILFVENNQQKFSKYIILKKPERISVSFKRLFARAQPWYIAAYSATIYFTLEYLSENEGRIFLSLKGYTLTYASYLISVAWAGYAIGSPLLGFLSGLYQRRKIIMVISAFISIISVWTIIYSLNTYLLFIAFFLLGVSTAAATISFATIAEQFKKQFVAIGFGLNNTVIMIFSAGNAPFMGWLLDHIKKDAHPNLGEYMMVFSILLIISILAFAISFFLLQETYCKSVVDFTFLKARKANNIKK